MALGVGGLAAVLAQIPGGALADAVSSKRALTAVGILMICGAALVLAFVPAPTMVFLAELLHGSTAGLITPAISAISLGLVGRRAMSVRTGRNYRFSGAGHVLTAAAMDAAGAFLADRAIFVVAAILCAPALIALSYIRPEEIDYQRARNAKGGQQLARVTDLAKNHQLLLFGTCIVLFQLADASILPPDWREARKAG